MSNIETTKYEDILQTLNALSDAQQLQLIRDLSAKLQAKLAGAPAGKKSAATRKTLADLRGILKDVRFSEDEL